MFKALLVDDSLNFRSALYEALHSRFPFCDFVGVDGVESALHKVSISKMQPDVILTDLVLLDGSGLDLIRRLRAMGVTTAIAVITIHDLPEYREEAERSGANKFFAKLSMSVHDIFHYIDALLATRLRALVICGEPGLNKTLGALLAARWPNMVTARTSGLEEGVQTGRLLKPQLVLFHSDDDGERERLYCQTLSIGCRGIGMRLVCVRNAPAASPAPAGADFVVSRAADFEEQLARIVDLIRAEHRPPPLAA